MRVKVPSIYLIIFLTALRNPGVVWPPIRELFINQLKHIAMNKEELEKLSKEELIEKINQLGSKARMYDYVNKENVRLREILSCVGIAYGTFEKEFKPQ